MHEPSAPPEKEKPDYKYIFNVLQNVHDPSCKPIEEHLVDYSKTRIFPSPMMKVFLETMYVEFESISLAVDFTKNLTKTNKEQFNFSKDKYQIEMAIWGFNYNPEVTTLKPTQFVQNLVSHLTF